MNSLKKVLSAVFALIIALTIFQATAVSATVQSTTEDIKVLIDGVPVDMRGTPPVIQQGRTLVGARDVFEALGFTVTWNGDRQEARFVRWDFTLYMWIGSSSFEIINHVTGVDSAGTLDVPAQIIGGSTMIPLRFPLEAVGYELSWSGSTQTVHITTANRKPIPTPTPAPLGRGARTTNSNAIRPRSELTDLEFAIAVWEYINLWREELGLRPYLWDDRLAEASQLHSDSMEQHNYFSHSSQFNGSPGQRARATGWTGGVGESGEVIRGGVDEFITMGNTTPAAAVRAYYNSPSHRPLITVRDFDGSEGVIGVGHAGSRVTVKAGELRHANIHTLVDSMGLNEVILTELGLN